MVSTHQLAGIGRDIIKYASGAALMAGSLAIISQGHANDIVADLKHLQNAGNELALALLGPGGLIALGMTVWTYFLNSHKAVVESAAKVPGTTVVTTQEIADATPQDNIVSAEEVKVVPK